MMNKFLITGAAGLLGRCIVNQLLRAGCDVVATSRSVGQSAFRVSSRLRVIQGDLTDFRFVDTQVKNVDLVINCAAKTTNWGTAGDFEGSNVATARNLAIACEQRGVKRLLHVSSLAVYGHPKPSGRLITEADPIGQRLLTFDRYVRSKIAAEQAITQLGDKATIIRPTWFIGPGDQVFVSSLVRKLEKRAVWILGSGDNLLNGLAVDDVARGAVLAATDQRCGGEVLNLCSSGELTQKALLDMVCQHQGLPSVRRRVPLGLAWGYASLVEQSARITRRKTKPPVTRHDLTVFTRPTIFSHAKATEMLGWTPLVPLGEALKQTLSNDCHRTWRLL